MYRHLLIATDGSELAMKAVRTGLGLAKALAARVSAVTVTEPWTAYAAPEAMIAYPTAEYDKAAEANAANILADVSAAAKEAGIACETVHVRDRYPADGIIDAAGELGCDLIVMASHGRRGIARLLLGSQAMQVLTHSPLPVLICR